MNVIAFRRKTSLDTIKLTVVFDDLALFCKTAMDHLAGADAFTRLQARQLVSITHFIAHRQAAVSGRSVDSMLQLAPELVRHSDAMLYMVTPHLKPDALSAMARTVFSQPPTTTPDAPTYSLDEKSAVLTSLGAIRFARLIAQP